MGFTKSESLGLRYAALLYSGKRTRRVLLPLRIVEKRNMADAGLPGSCKKRYTRARRVLLRLRIAEKRNMADAGPPGFCNNRHTLPGRPMPPKDVLVGKAVTLRHSSTCRDPAA